MGVKLTDLKPRWFTDAAGYRGFTFLCPHCRAERIQVKQTWTIAGDNFETVTVNPSLNLLDHWHGNVINGEIHNA